MKKIFRCKITNSNLNVHTLSVTLQNIHYLIHFQIESGADKNVRSLSYEKKKLNHFNTDVNVVPD